LGAIIPVLILLPHLSMLYVIAGALEISELPGRACLSCRQWWRHSGLRWLFPAERCCDAGARMWFGLFDRPLLGYVICVTAISLSELCACVAALHEPSLSECTLPGRATLPLEMSAWLRWQAGISLVNALFPAWFQRRVWKRLVEVLELQEDADGRAGPVPKRKVQDCVRHTIASDRFVQLYGAFLALSFCVSLLCARRVRQGAMQGLACDPDGNSIWACFCGMYAVCFSLFFLVTAARRGCGVCGDESGEWGFCAQHKEIYVRDVCGKSPPGVRIVLATARCTAMPRSNGSNCTACGPILP
ncbi:unnamed protein product, partial [Prorocentrum cordatum]